MLKEFVKKLALMGALSRLPDTMMGRALLRQAVSIASKETMLPLSLDKDGKESDYWQLTAGTPDAGIYIRCRIRSGSLSELIDTAATAWLENRKLRPDDIMQFLVKHLNG